MCYLGRTATVATLMDSLDSPPTCLCSCPPPSPPGHPACLAPLVILQIHVWWQQARWQQVRKRQARQQEAAQGGVHTTPVKHSSGGGGGSGGYPSGSAAHHNHRAFQSHRQTQS
ncbi:unnamed protein product [Closterium sp. NIES-53]